MFAKILVTPLKLIQEADKALSMLYLHWSGIRSDTGKVEHLRYLFNSYFLVFSVKSDLLHVVSWSLYISEAYLELNQALKLECFAISQNASSQMIGMFLNTPLQPILFFNFYTLFSEIMCKPHDVNSLYYLHQAH